MTRRPLVSDEVETGCCLVESGRTITAPRASIRGSVRASPLRGDPVSTTNSAPGSLLGVAGSNVATSSSGTLANKSSESPAFNP